MDAALSCSLPFIQSWIPACGTVPPTLRVSLPTSVNPTKKSLTDASLQYSRSCQANYVNRHSLVDNKNIVFSIEAEAAAGAECLDTQDPMADV